MRLRDDLLDAQAAVDWAVAQIPLFREAFDAWERGSPRPYRLLRERDPETDGYLVVAIKEAALPLTFNAWIGAIFNSLRTALDMVAVALAHRNGERTNPYRHFPIFDSELDMIDPLHGIDGPERKKWLSDHDRTAIKALKPYKGGNDPLWTLHKLDIIRKHERLLLAQLNIDAVLILGNARMRPFVSTPIARHDNKTILARMSRSEAVPISEGNTFPTVDILIDEASLGVDNEQVFPALRRFWLRVNEVVQIFND